MLRPWPEEGVGDLGALGFLETEWGVRNRGCRRDSDTGEKLRGREGLAFTRCCSTANQALRGSRRLALSCSAALMAWH